MQSPCLDCCQRHQGCHDICPSYQEYKEERESISQQVKEDNKFIGYESDAMVRMGVGRRGFR